MKIVIFEIEPWEQQAFEALEGAHELAYENGRLTEAKAGHLSDADIVSTFIHSFLARDGTSPNETRACGVPVGCRRRPRA